jgi:hypothetical protein
MFIDNKKWSIFNQLETWLFKNATCPYKKELDGEFHLVIVC